VGADEALCVEEPVVADTQNGDPKAAVSISTVKPVPVSLASTELARNPNEHECASECSDMR